MRVMKSLPQHPSSFVARSPLLPFLLGALAACGGGDSGGDGGPMAPAQVTGVTVTPTTSTITVGEEVDLQVTVQRSDGTSGAPTSVAFSVQDEEVASVDDEGVIEGQAEGETQVTATSEGVSANVQVTVETRLNEDTQVLDSTIVALVSTAEQRAAGEYRFTGADPDEFEVGSIIVGSQEEGFLRRVVGVEADGDQVVVNTDFASLEEAVEGGTFQSSVELDIGAAPVPAMVNGVHWGPTEVVYTAPGVSATRAGFVFDGAVLYQDQVCGTHPQTGAQVCGTFTVDVPAGSVDFAPTIDMGASFSLFSGLREFHAIGTGTLTSNVDLRATAQLQGEVGGEKTFATVSRRFITFIGAVPVEGQIRLDLVGAFNAKLNLEGSVTSGATGSATVSAGARYVKGGGWAPAFEQESDFETRPLNWDLKTGAELKFDAKPVFTMILYEFAGPSASAYPYVTFAGEIGLDDCSYNGSVTAGIDMDVGFNIEILGQAIEDYTTTVNGPSTVLLGKEGKLVEELHAVGGAGQEGEPGAQLSQPVEILVTDSDVMPSEGITVEFETTPGSGSVSPSTVVTNAQGQVAAVWTLGPDEGTHQVTATTPDCEGANTVTFSAEAIAPEEPEGPTGTVSGHVELFVDGGSSDLEGATITATLIEESSVSGTGASEGGSWPEGVVGPASGGGAAAAATTATTDANGDFELVLPPGDYLLDISAAGVVTTRVFQTTVLENGTETLGTLQVVPTSSSTGDISGQVLRNPTDKFPVPDALVQFRSGIFAPDTEEVLYSTSTGSLDTPEQGKFTLVELAPGTYTVRVQAPGGGVNRATVLVIGGTTRDPVIYVHPDG